MTSENCLVCGKALTNDDIGATKKLINRGATEFLCVDCLAAHFRVSPEDVREKIRQFKEQGCMLFN